MAFLEDPRLRQRWNRIAHDAETVTENAAAGIWSFQHNYINPCLGSMAASVNHCTGACLGNPEDRLRRRRERERARGGGAEYDFDFYDDWYQDEHGISGGGGGGGGALLGNWGGEDWDQLLAGSGSSRRRAGAETTEQPRRKRGMSYGTRSGQRRRSGMDDPTIIPSTQPIGFLGRLPWKLGGTLRYKPSAADLQDRPVRQGTRAETEPLLGSGDGSGERDMDSDVESEHMIKTGVPGERRPPRQRSGTTGSGDTSDSIRSRGDIFPSDGEGEEDAVALDDEVTYDMLQKDDRSSGKTRSSKGKRRDEGSAGSRTVSRSSTLASAVSLEAADRTLEPPTTVLPEANLANKKKGQDEGRGGHDIRQQQEQEKLARNRAAFALSAPSEKSLDDADDAGGGLMMKMAPGPKLVLEEGGETGRGVGGGAERGATLTSERGTGGGGGDDKDPRLRDAEGRRQQQQQQQQQQAELASSPTRLQPRPG